MIVRLQRLSLLLPVLLVPAIVLGQPITVLPGYVNQSSIGRYDPVTLLLSRPLTPEDGRLAVFIGPNDVSAFLEATGDTLRYNPTWTPMSSGNQEILIYLVSADGQWQELARFPIWIQTLGGFEKVDVTPNLTLNNKGQLAREQFPEPGVEDPRNTYQDISGQFNLRSEFTRPAWSFQTQVNVMGVSYQNEALRFFEDGEDAPRVDLSDYMVQMQRGGFNIQIGHVLHGSNRLLMDNFGSRGMRTALKLRSNVDVSVAAMNGSRVVGWSNPLGLNDLDHRMFSGAIGLEALENRPGGLRIEASFLDASVLPRNNFNQASVTDAESSRGAGVRVQGTTAGQRIRFDGGLAGSRYTNPADPLLNQNEDVVPVQPENKFAHYANVTLGLLQNVNLSPTFPINLSANYRRDQAAPLYRSVPTFVRADIVQNAYALQGSVGAVSAQFSHNRSEDNLDDVPSILKTRTRQNSLNVNLPLNSLAASNPTLTKLLPSLSYSFNQTHQFGDEVPENSGFNESHVPDQKSMLHNAGANWNTRLLQFGYRFSSSFQDNRQTERENADFLNRTHNVFAGINLSSILNLSVDFSIDEAENKADGRIDKTQRIGIRMNLRPVQNLSLSSNVAPTVSENRQKTSRRTNSNINMEASYTFGLGGNPQRQRIRGQVFIRYARQASTQRDLLFDLDSENRFWTLNSGVSLSIF